jgi:glycosyltransferase involved in cell wall biosynthesis
MSRSRPPVSQAIPQLKVLHVVASLAEVSGGPPRSVVNLCQQLAAAGLSVEILTLDNARYFGPAVGVDDALIKVERVPCWFFRPLRLILSPAFQDAAAKAISRTEVVHSHGLWLGVNRQAGLLARTLGKGHVLSPRGNLDPACLCQSKWKKNLARRWFVDRNLATANCIHVTSVAEAGHVRALGFKTRIVNIPPAVALPALNEDELRTAFTARWPELEGKRYMLFLARVIPHKGILYLAEAWAKLHRQVPDWQLVIAGPDEMGCVEQVKTLLGLAAAQTSILGSVSGIHKWALLSRCEFLVHPSHSENFGHSIAEALSIGKPVLTTSATPWESISQHNAGWVIAVGAAPLLDKLPEVLNLDHPTLAKLGANGRQLVASAHNPSTITSRFVDLYRSVAGLEPASLAAT